MSMPRRDTNPQSQQASRRRHTPYTARPPASPVSLFKLKCSSYLYPLHVQKLCRITDVSHPRNKGTSSSIGTTAHCGLWPVEQCPSIFSYLPPTLHLLTPSTWRSLSTSSFHPFLGLPLLVPSSSWGKIFLGILSSSILSRWPNQLILCPFIHFTVFSPLLISSSSRFVRLFHSPFSYLWPYILLNIFLFKN